MPNGRNAEGWNADNYWLLPNFQEGAEMKACPWQKYQVPLIV